MNDDETEMRKTFMSYIRPNAESRSLVERDVPGDNRKYLTQSDEARKGTDALIAWNMDLYDEGYYLDGDFKGDDFGIDFCGNLKGKNSLLPLVKKLPAAEAAAAEAAEGPAPADAAAAVVPPEAPAVPAPAPGEAAAAEAPAPAGAAAEMLSKQLKVVAKIVLKEIHSVDSYSLVPADVSHLLKQLTKPKDQISCPLIRNHASLEEEGGKDTLFTDMRKNLKTIELRDLTMYEDIIEEIARIPDVKGWVQRAMNNSHLHAVLRFRQRKGNAPKSLKDVITVFLSSGVCYSEDVGGLLDFRRNGDAHLEVDYSVDTIGYLEAGLHGASKGLNRYYEQEKEKLENKQRQEVVDLYNQQEKERTDLQKKQQRERQWHQQQQRQPQRQQRQQQRRPQRQQQPQPQPLEVTHNEECQSLDPCSRCEQDPYSHREDSTQRTQS